MQETFDFYTLIIIITFLSALLFLAFFINKVSKFAPDNNSHVKNIQSTILSFFGINN